MSLPSPDKQPLLTPTEVLAAIQFPFSRASFYRKLAAGEFPVKKWGSRIFIVNSELQRQLGLSDRTPSAIAVIERDEGPDHNIGASADPGKDPHRDAEYQHTA